MIVKKIGGEKMKTQQAQAAKAIRKDLKKAFPKTKFSVRSGSGANTSSVNVYWTDGPKEDGVTKITSKYQYGYFDGIQDLYEYSNIREDIPQAKFVFANRRMSQGTKKRLIKEHNVKYKGEAQIKDYEGFNKPFDCWNNTLISRKFREYARVL
jgi:hypothetical protein